jgi:hypothetical protein
MRKLLFLLVLLAPIGAYAHEARIGLLIHDVAPLFGAIKVEGGFDLNGEVIMGMALVRPMVGISVNSRGQTSCAYCGVVVSLVGGSATLCVGAGGAVQVNSIRDLGSRLQFRLALEIGYGNFSILFSHLSNGAGFFWWDISNAGLDKIGIRYRIRL